MKSKRKYMWIAVLLFSAVMFVCFAKPEKTLAVDSSYKKIADYVKSHGTKGTYDTVTYVKIDNNIRLGYDSTNESIIVEESIDYNDDYDWSKSKITVLINSNVNEVKLGYQRETATPLHPVSSESVTEILYKNSKGNKYKYLASWFYWSRESGEEESYLKDTLVDLEKHWLEIADMVSKFTKSKIGVEFKPFTAVSGYSSIKEPYREKINATYDVKLPFYIGADDISDMHSGDVKTYVAMFDFNGDGKTDRLTAKCTMTSSTKINLVVRIEGKKFFETELYPGEEGSYGFSTFDLNPGDKNKELSVIHNGVWLTSYQLYRYNGTKVKKMQSFDDMYTTLLKQKKDDKLQVSKRMDIPQIGETSIEVSLAKDNTIAVNSKGIYTCKGNNDYKYQFNKQITLYKTTECKKSTGSISRYDYGKVTKIKIDKKTKRVVLAYVVLNNGKKGWIKLDSGSWDYLVTNPTFGG